MSLNQWLSLALEYSTTTTLSTDLSLSQQPALPPLQFLVILLQAVLERHFLCEGCGMGSWWFRRLCVVELVEPFIETIHSILKEIKTSFCTRHIKLITQSHSNLVCLSLIISFIPLYFFLLLADIFLHSFVIVFVYCKRSTFGCIFFLAILAESSFR